MRIFTDQSKEQTWSLDMEIFFTKITLVNPVAEKKNYCKCSDNWRGGTEGYLVSSAWNRAKLDLQQNSTKNPTTRLENLSIN